MKELVLAACGTVIAILRLRRRGSISVAGDHHPDLWLQKAVNRMQRIPPPLQSSFRVYAILTYTDRSTGQTGWVSGTNCEPVYIGGSICAERSAASQLRELPSSCEVTAIYLVSDMADCITPGMLCREFLHSCCALDTPIHLAGRTMQHRRSTTLRKLYAYPHVYARVRPAEVASFAAHVVASAAESFRTEVVARKCPEYARVLYDAVRREVAKPRDDDVLHVVRYAGGVMFEDGTMVVEVQRKTLEYGSDLDAIRALIPAIDRKAPVKPTIMVHMDQYGVLHAPFAPARSQLYERSTEARLEFLVHTMRQSTSSSPPPAMAPLASTDQAMFVAANMAPQTQPRGEYRAEWVAVGDLVPDCPGWRGACC